MTSHWSRGALVERDKLEAYLLALDHPRGSSKARYFARAGYSRGDWWRLRADLLRAAATATPSQAYSTPYGEKLIVPLEFIGPTRRRLHLVTVWVRPTVQHSFRLVTAYPRRTP